MTGIPEPSDGHGDFRLVHTSDKELIPAMSKSFQEVLNQRNELLHRWSIRQEIYSYLERFVDTDVRKADVGIKTDGEGLVVPQELIVETRENILADMAEIMFKVKMLEKREVAENDNEEEEDAEEEDDEGGEGEEEDAGDGDEEADA
jgi:hypothetical protein